MAKGRAPQWRLLEFLGIVYVYRQIMNFWAASAGTQDSLHYIAYDYMNLCNFAIAKAVFLENFFHNTAYRINGLKEKEIV